MNEQEIGNEIARLLDRSMDENIKQSTLYRLQSVRRAALENCRPTTKIINAGAGTSAHGGQFNAGKLLLLTAMLLAFAITFYWQISRENDENAAIDTMILADDLPIDAYLDNEFDEWLGYD